MKKIIILLFLILISATSHAYASPQFDEVLSSEIQEYGVFENGQGIVYAGENNFQDRESLLIVRIEQSDAICEVYDDSDGIQLTDSLKIPLEKSCRLSLITYGGRDYLMLSGDTDNSKQIFSVQNDSFMNAAGFDYDTIQDIVGYEQGQVVPYIPVERIYNFLNSLKEKTISSYTFINRVNSIGDEDATAIRSVISACADIMSFDIKNYDYDTMFKYILYTHENFRILTDISPSSSGSSSLGYNNVSIVNSDYIDYVLENIFRITPEKPPVNNLLSRGFCYSDGYYYYTGGFDVFFATEFRDLKAVYDIGGGVMFVIFSDIYYEGGKEAPEYSFAVLQKTSGGYSLLRLGMGENLPTQAEIRLYSPFSNYGKPLWSEGKPYVNRWRNDLLLPVLLLIVSVGIVGLVCSIVVLLRMRR
ncbi:MAG: hypothetical protein J1F01_02970 [Oscillospiraceae bacterium]|nr:hypothetical protein [Oscillospiraceae bacterium]